MTTRFNSLLGEDMVAFLEFKRALGYGYERGEFSLRAFDHFVATRCRSRAALRRLPEVFREWLTRSGDRMPITIAAEYFVIRQFCLFRRRRDPRAFVPPREWTPASIKSNFLPRILSKKDILRVLRGTSLLRRPDFRATLYRALLLILYCTGLRFGEALRLRIRDVDIDGLVLFVTKSKGRARWVPFHSSLARELRSYFRARRDYARAQPDDRFFVGQNRKHLSVNRASETVRKLLRRAGLKPSKGRIGVRPYDFRHAFAVHRLERWYRAGVDLHTRLPWLSAYMGHDNIIGTERYLHATPWLLETAARRLYRRLTRRSPPL
jgi:integrase/recombinase XerD